jgi:hypothetical protein
VNEFQTTARVQPRHGKNAEIAIMPGRYNPRLHTLSKAFHDAKLPIEMTGSDGRLENFCDSQHGYLKITVTKDNIAVEYFAVPDPSSPATKPLLPFDTINIAL